MAVEQEELVLMCPKCGRADKLDIVAAVWVRWLGAQHGTDADEAHDGSHEFDEDSQAHCVGCSWNGTVKDATV